MLVLGALVFTTATAAAQNANNARVSFEHRSDAGASFELVAAAFYVDGKRFMVATRLENTQVTMEDGQLDLPAGEHEIRASLVFRGVNAGPFTYHEDYIYRVHRTFRLDLGAHQHVTIGAVGRSEGDMTTPHDDRLRIEFETKEGMLSVEDRPKAEEPAIAKVDESAASSKTPDTPDIPDIATTANRRPQPTPKTKTPETAAPKDEESIDTYEFDALVEAAAGPKPEAPATPGIAAPMSAPTGEETVRFTSASDTLGAEARRQLDALGRFLEAHPEVARVRVFGHADDVGTWQRNRALSIARARVVERYLLNRFEIEPKRLVVRAYGESQPATDGRDPASRALNRRVEIKFQRAPGTVVTAARSLDTPSS